MIILYYALQPYSSYFKGPLLGVHCSGSAYRVDVVLHGSGLDCRRLHSAIVGMHIPYPKGPCTQIVSTLALK